MANTAMTITRALPRVGYLAVLIMILLLTFTLFGKELYAGTGLRSMSRWHFDSTFPAMLTVTSVFSGNWASGFFAARSVSSSFTATVFFFGALVIGFFIATNLFIAVLVDEFIEDEENRREEDATANRYVHGSEEEDEEADATESVSEARPSSRVRGMCFDVDVCEQAA